MIRRMLGKKEVSLYDYKDIYNTGLNFGYIMLATVPKMHQSRSALPLQTLNALQLTNLCYSNSLSIGRNLKTLTDTMYPSILPFNNPALGSSHMPTCMTIFQDRSQTHPANSSIFSSPIISLWFAGRSSSGGLVCEEAIIFGNTSSLMFSSQLQDSESSQQSVQNIGPPSSQSSNHLILIAPIVSL